MTRHLEKTNTSNSHALTIDKLAVPKSNEETLKSQLISLADNLSKKSALELVTTIEQLENELQQLPTELHLFCSKAYLLINDLNKANFALSKANLNDPIAKGIAHELINRYLIIKQTSQALFLLHQLLQQNDHTDDTGQTFLLINQLAEAECQAGQANKAAQYWADLVALAPEKTDLKKRLENAKRWLEEGQIEAALILLMALNAVFGRQPILMQLLASSHESIGNYEAAAMVYREIIQPNHLAR